MIITRKIELRLHEDNKEIINETWRYLRELDNSVYRCANHIISGQYFNDTFRERIMMTDESILKRLTKIENEIDKCTKIIKDCKDSTKKQKLEANRKKLYKTKTNLSSEARTIAETYYTTGEQNSTYQSARKNFPNIPSNITTCINQIAVKAYKNDYFDVLMGKRSIRSYRKGMPIPFQKIYLDFRKEDSGEITMNWINKIVFKLNFGRDKSNNREIVDRVMSNNYKKSDSSIKVDGKKIFLLLCVDIGEEEHELDMNVHVGVNLGINVPAYCVSSNGYARQQLGSKQDFFRVRRQMQERRRNIQKTLVISRGGKGRDKKLKALTHIKNKERNFAKTYNHKISHEIVRFALKNKAGIIKMELLEGYGDNLNKELTKLVLRNWSYYELHQLVEYKAKKKGIKVVYVDPYKISQTCHCCGHSEENQWIIRESETYFQCKNSDCSNKDKNGKNKMVHYDYNAAINNVNSNKIVENKTECEFYKKNLQTA